MLFVLCSFSVAFCLQLAIICWCIFAIAQKSAVEIALKKVGENHLLFEFIVVINAELGILIADTHTAILAFRQIICNLFANFSSFSIFINCFHLIKSSMGMRYSLHMGQMFQPVRSYTYTNHNNRTGFAC